MPGAFDPPEAVVARLREVDPLVDLVYLGEGVWVLGSVQPNQFRVQVANRLIESERQRPAELQSLGRYRMARLMRAGLRVIEMYDWSAIDSGRLLHEFRLADYNFRNRANAAFEANLRGSDMDIEFEKRVATMLDYTASELPSVWAHAFRGRRHILQPGAGSWNQSNQALARVS